LLVKGIMDINMIVPSAPGGQAELMIRTLSPLSQEVFGQPLIIQVRPGGGGAVGIELLNQAKPDGYTLAVGKASWLPREPPGRSSKSWPPVSRR